MEEISGYWLRTFPIVFTLRVSLKIYFLQQWVRDQRQIDFQRTIWNRIFSGKERDDFRSNDPFANGTMLLRRNKKMKWERIDICYKESALNIDMRKWHQWSLRFSLGLALDIHPFYSEVAVERLSSTVTLQQLFRQASLTTIKHDHRAHKWTTMESLMNFSHLVKQFFAVVQNISSMIWKVFTT